MRLVLEAKKSRRRILSVEEEGDEGQDMESEGDHFSEATFIAWKATGVC